jgi:hypothetical protein
MAPVFAALSTAAIANILGPWFIKKPGLAMSLALTGGGAGGLAIVPTLVWLNAKFSFPAALQIVAAISIAILLTTIVLCIRQPNRQEAAVTEGGAAAAMSVLTHRSALGSAHYWTIAAPLMLAIMVQVGFIVHQASFLLPLLGLEGAGLAVSLTALMAAASRVVASTNVSCGSATKFSAEAVRPRISAAPQHPPKSQGVAHRREGSHPASFRPPSRARPTTASG